MKYDYTVIFASPGACRVPAILANRRPNPARLPPGITRAAGLAPLLASERKLLTAIARGGKPWARYARGGWKRFLTPPTANPKIEKGLRKYGIATAVLHLAPFIQSGKQVCVFATPGCAAGCLTTAGRGGIPGEKELEEIVLLSGDLYTPPNEIQQARVLKTMFFFEDRPGFMRRLANAIVGFVKWARKRRMHAAIRLNGTSDIQWENIGFEFGGRRYSSLMQAFPGVQFYDYTKNPQRITFARRAAWPKNYHLTFSIAEATKKNVGHAEQALSQGLNLAVVFNVKKGEPLPRRWGGLPVIDADLHDMRFLDNWENKIDGPLIAGLRAKGRAKVDRSGFVRNVGGPEDEFFSGAPIFEDGPQPVFLMGRAS